MVKAEFYNFSPFPLSHEATYLLLRSDIKNRNVLQAKQRTAITFTIAYSNDYKQASLSSKEVDFGLKCSLLFSLHNNKIMYLKTWTIHELFENEVCKCLKVMVGVIRAYYSLQDL